MFSSLCVGICASLKSGNGGKDISFLVEKRSAFYSLSFRTILAAAVTLLLASPQPGTAFLFPGMLCPHADVPIRRKSHQSSPPPPPPYLAWGQRNPVLDYA